MSVDIVPARTEPPEYYWKYMDLVPRGEISAVLDAQTDDMVSIIRQISEERSLHRYAPDKWSIRQALGHMNDTERVFAFELSGSPAASKAPYPVSTNRLLLRIPLPTTVRGAVISTNSLWSVRRL